MLGEFTICGFRVFGHRLGYFILCSFRAFRNQRSKRG